MTTSTWFRSGLVAGVLALGAGCSSEETAPPADDHTPVSFVVLVNGDTMPRPYTFTAGRTIRVQLKFQNAAGEDLDDVESSHYAALTFEPASLASALPVADHHFQLDVTGGTPQTGQMTVGFGHDAAADEHTFNPVTAVTLQDLTQ